MENNGFAINREATEAVFAKYGGTKEWLESCDWDAQSEIEIGHIATISMATLMQLNEQKLILESEQEQVFAVVEAGINFGLYVLGYNFMIDSDRVQGDYYLNALEFWAGKSESYIDLVSSEDYDPASIDEPDTAHDELGEDLEGYMKVVDIHIDEVCPDLSLQDDFRKGAKAAECVFICALKLVEHVEVIRMNDNFFKLVEDIDLEI